MSDSGPGVKGVNPLVVEIGEAYRRWRMQATTRPVILPGHVCSARECKLVRTGRTFICLLTGNMHVCTGSTCDGIQESIEYAICPLTRLQYPLLPMNPSEEPRSFGGPGRGNGGGGGGGRSGGGAGVDYSTRVTLLDTVLVPMSNTQPHVTTASMSTSTSTAIPTTVLPVLPVVPTGTSDAKKHGPAHQPPPQPQPHQQRVAAQKRAPKRPPKSDKLQSKERREVSALIDRLFQANNARIMALAAAARGEWDTQGSTSNSTSGGSRRAGGGGGGRNGTSASSRKRSHGTAFGSMATASGHARNVRARQADGGGGRHQVRQPRLVGPEELTDDLIERTTRLCLQTWKILSPRAPCRKQPSKYSFVNHCLVLLYCMAEPSGFTCSEFTIPYEPVMAAGLPPINDLRLPPLYLSYTPAYNIFLAALD